MTTYLGTYIEMIAGHSENDQYRIKNCYF